MKSQLIKKKKKKKKKCGCFTKVQIVVNYMIRLTFKYQCGLQKSYFHVCLYLIILGPVVQSVVSLTSSLRVISLTVLADSIYNILIFFAEKM